MIRRLVLTVGVSLGCLVSPVAWCQSGNFQSSLDVVPQDAAFYFATMNHPVFWQGLTESRAWKQWLDSPLNRKLRTAYRKRAQGFDRLGDNPLRYYLEGYANSLDSIAGKAVVPYLNKLFAQECFVYTNRDWIHFMNAWSATTQDLKFLESEVESPEGWSPETTLKVLDTISRNFQDVQAPVFVVGALVDDPDAFTSLLNVAESALTPLLKDAPPEMQFLAEGFQSTNEPGLRMMAFNLKGDNLPWDEMANEFSNADQAALNSLKQLLASKTLSVCLAVRNNLLTFSVGPTSDHLRDPGQSPRLVDLDVFRPIRETIARGERLVGVYYHSAESVAASQSGMLQAISNLPATVVASLKQAEEHSLSASAQAQLLGDLQRDTDELKQDIQRYLGTPGALLGFAYQSSVGIEGSLRNYSVPENRTESRDLELLRNLGDKPLIAALGRENAELLHYSLLRKWGGKILHYVTTYVPESLDDDERAAFKQGVERFLPLLNRLDQTTAEEVLPSLAGGEWLLLVSTGIAKSQWGAFLPDLQVPVPLPAFALVAQISDDTKVKQALVEYHAVGRDLVRSLREWTADPSLDEFEFPELVRETKGTMEVFQISLPESLPIDRAVLPHIMIGQGKLIIATHPEHSESLLGVRTTSLFGPASEPKPAVGALWFDHRQWVQFLEAWAAYGFEYARQNGQPLVLESRGELPDLQMSEDEIRETLRRGFRLLNCFEGFSSRSFQEGDAQVQQFLFKFSDLAGD